MRGTTRVAERRRTIEAAGAEAVVADPDRLGTLIAHLRDISVICWLMASAAGAPELHGARLRTLMERLVDTPVRGFVYEAAGTLEPALLAGGAAIVRGASATWRIPVEVVDADPRSRASWVEGVAAAVGRLLEPRGGEGGEWPGARSRSPGARPTSPGARPEGR